MRLGGVVLVGEAPGVGGEQLFLRGQVLTPAISRRHLCARNGLAGECAAALERGRETGREERGRGWQHRHGTFVSNLGCGMATAGTARPWAAAAMGAWLRPPGGARERVECEGSGAEVKGVGRARVRGAPFKADFRCVVDVVLGGV